MRTADYTLEKKTTNHPVMQKAADILIACQKFRTITVHNFYKNRDSKAS